MTSEPVNSLADRIGPVGVREPAPLRHQVVDALRTAILDSRVAPGQRLVERELLETLGVSRTTVREALRELSASGLLELVPGRGVMVRSLSYREVEDLYDVRESLEVLLLRRFGEQATPADLQRLSNQVERFATATTDGTELSDQLLLKDEFYRVLLEVADRPVLGTLIDQIKDRVQLMRATSMGSPGRARRSAAELRGVAAALTDGNVGLAVARYRSHLRRARKLALSQINPADTQPGRRSA